MSAGLVRRAIAALRVSLGVCRLGCGARATVEVLLGCAACGSESWHLCATHAAAIVDLSSSDRMPACERPGGGLRLVAVVDLAL